MVSGFAANCRSVIIPRDNENDLIDVPEEVRRDLSVLLVEHVDEVLKAALHVEKTAEAPRLEPATSAN